MRKVLAKTALSAFVGVGLAAAVAATPAEAGYFRGGGGWHGGGWHGGGWGGGWHGGYWNGGWRGGGWRGGYWGGAYPGWGWGGGWGYPGWGWGWGAPVIVAGGPYYVQPDNGCWVARRVWSLPGGRGRYLGRHLVNVCQ